MLLNVTANLSYAAPQQCDALLQIEPTNDGGQRCIDPVLTLLSGTTVGQQQGEDSIGLRRWLSVDTHLECQFTAQVEVGRPNVDFATLAETPKDKLATAVIPYLMPSRYCQSDLFLDFTASQFGTLSGGTCVQAMNDWVAANFTYDIYASNPNTTATDSFQAQRGVCRDYAHVLIALIRAVGIPARFVSAYAPNVKPQDFHAVVEVYLDGDWHLIDPTGMADAASIVRICVGRDAADASFLTSYGPLNLQGQSVAVTQTTT